MTCISKYERRFLLYFHRSADTNEIFYVGIGVKGRQRKVHGRSEYWKNYVAKHGGHTVEVYRTNLNWPEACHLEGHFIRTFGRKKFEKNGILVNLTLGGEGNTGVKWSERQREIMIAANLGRKRTEESKKKQSDSTRGVARGPYSQERILNMSNSLRGKKRPFTTDSHRKNLGKSVSATKMLKAKKVINTETGEVFSSRIEAVANVSYKLKYFTSMLGGHERNKTPFMYLDDYNSGNGIKIKY